MLYYSATLKNKNVYVCDKFIMLVDSWVLYFILVKFFVPVVCEIWWNKLRYTKTKHVRAVIRFLMNCYHANRFGRITGEQIKDAAVQRQLALPFSVHAARHYRCKPFVIIRGDFYGARVCLSRYRRDSCIIINNSIKTSQSQTASCRQPPLNLTALKNEWADRLCGTTRHDSHRSRRANVRDMTAACIRCRRP